MKRTPQLLSTLLGAGRVQGKAQDSASRGAWKEGECAREELSAGPMSLHSDLSGVTSRGRLHSDLGSQHLLLELSLLSLAL